MSSIMLDIQAMDWSCSTALNGLALAMPGLSRLAAFAAGADTFKTLGFVLLVVAAWHHPPREATRPLVLRASMGVLLAMVLGRILPALLPFRARPLHNPSLALATPPGVSPEALSGWTSFPSDHGMLFGALVVLAFALGRRVGWVALVFVVVGIWFPRLLLGYHFLSDIVVGAALGAGCVMLTLRLPQTATCAALLLRQEAARPALFYPLAMLALLQLAQMFVPLRASFSIARLILN